MPGKSRKALGPPNNWVQNTKEPTFHIVARKLSSKLSRISNQRCGIPGFLTTKTLNDSTKSYLYIIKAQASIKHLLEPHLMVPCFLSFLLLCWYISLNMYSGDFFRSKHKFITYQRPCLASCLPRTYLYWHCFIRFPVKLKSFVRKL